MTIGSPKAKKVKLLKKTFHRPYLTAGQAARHCQVSIPALKRWVRERGLRAFKTPGGHYRIEVSEFQRFLRQHSMPAYPAASTSARILIVDDESLIVDLLVDLLGPNTRGFKVETATDGYEALIKVGALKPDLLILDVVMPLVDGIEVCRRLKANPQTWAIKILGVTGYPDMIPALMEAGADACFTKPLDPEQVTQEVERLLAMPVAHGGGR